MAELLLAAGLDAARPALFLLEGAAVYLELPVLEALLRQLRQVAAPGSRLAISVSLSREHDEAARARFRASVAAMGEPARSTFAADEAADLLARTGWHLTPEDRAPEDRAPEDRAPENRAPAAGRLHAAGLLLAKRGEP